MLADVENCVRLPLPSWPESVNTGTVSWKDRCKVEKTVKINKQTNKCRDGRPERGGQGSGGV